MKHLLLLVFCFSFSSMLYAQHQERARAQSFLVIFDTKSKAVRIFPNNRFTSVKLETSKRIIHGPFLADSLHLYKDTDTIPLDSLKFMQNVNPLLLLVGGATLIAAFPAAIELVFIIQWLEVGLFIQIVAAAIPFVLPFTMLDYSYKKQNIVPGKYFHSYQQFPFKYMFGYRK